MCFALSWNTVGLERDFFTVAAFWEHRVQIKFKVGKGKLESKDVYVAVSHLYSKRLLFTWLASYLVPR